MGANTFFEYGKGPNAAEAFRRARDHAQWEHGHGGYSGTLAEKGEFTLIPLPKGADPIGFANQLIEAEDPRIRDKWGPAGALDCGNGTFAFFGWASS
jgi:hypothetical protein